MSEKALHAIDPPRTVVVEGSAKAFRQEVRVGRHALVGDEPLAAGGADAGPTPYDLLLAALGTCTSMTLGLYARRKGWPLDRVRVELRHSRVHAEDCENCDTRNAMIDRIDRAVELVGALDSAQRARLMEIADRCPVHRTLSSGFQIRSSLVESRDGADPAATY
jgi:putative redox protein